MPYRYRVEYTEEEFQEQLVDEHSVNMVRVLLSGKFYPNNFP